jgi:hypothetical protein
MDQADHSPRTRHQVAVGYETLALLFALLWCALLVLDSLFAPAWERPLWIVLLVWVVVAGILVSGALVGELLERGWRKIDDTRRRTLAQLLSLLGTIGCLEGWVMARSVLSPWSLGRTLWNAGLGLVAFLAAAAFVHRWVRSGRSWAPVSNAWLVVQGMVLVSILVLAAVQLAIGW